MDYMEAIHVFTLCHSITHHALFYVWGERELHQDRIHFTSKVQVLYCGEEIRLGDRGREFDFLTLDT